MTEQKAAFYNSWLVFCLFNRMYYIVKSLFAIQTIVYFHVEKEGKEEGGKRKRKYKKGEARNYRKLCKGGGISHKKREHIKLTK